MVSRKDKHNMDYLGGGVALACIIGFFSNSSVFGIGTFIAVVVGLMVTGRLRL